MTGHRETIMAHNAAADALRDDVISKEMQDAYWIEWQQTQDHWLALAAAIKADKVEPVAWMHPTANWVHIDRAFIAMHCQKDGEQPLPLYRSASPSIVVAVKPLEWKDEYAGVKFSAETPFGGYGVRTDMGKWWEPGNYDTPNSDLHPMIAAEKHYLAAILSALTPAEKAGVGDGWQSIETAPKDGTIVDLWHEEFDRQADMYWGKPDHCCGEAGQYCDSDWHGEPEGWVCSSVNEVIFSDGYTHWRLPPSAPAGTTAQGYGE